MKSSIEPNTRFSFALYLVYLVSFFLHIPARIPFLGLIRFDLLLVASIVLSILSSNVGRRTELATSSKYLLLLIAYAVFSLPLVEWPGSVIGGGFEAFVKGIIFYFFTVFLVKDVNRLKILLIIFVACNLIRIIEPLVLNLTTGYLGSRTHLGYGEFAGRLSGAPSDVINPNGLAFVIASVFPFLHYVYAPTNKKTFLIYLILVPMLIYTMSLTLSRSGVVALAIIAFGIWLKSKRKVLVIFLCSLGLVLTFFSLNDIQKDRYLSIVSSDAKQSASAEGRIEGWFSDFRVAMNRPIFGHGLGSSREANWNVAGKDQISHILWAEVWQEVGLIGLIIFILYLKSMISNFLKAGKLVKANLDSGDFLYRCVQAMQVWLLMNLLFSLASYGLKSYEWYLFGGLSVVILNLVMVRIYNSQSADHRDLSVHESVGRFSLAQRINRIK
ncbi:MAG: O-antigen ligase family protein [Marinobacter sp.]|nr:O-antigen ligase family protein [Marinobacter sp.]